MFKNVIFIKKKNRRLDNMVDEPIDIENPTIENSLIDEYEELKNKYIEVRTDVAALQKRVEEEIHTLIKPVIKTNPAVVFDLSENSEVWLRIRLNRNNLNTLPTVVIKKIDEYVGDEGYLLMDKHEWVLNYKKEE